MAHAAVTTNPAAAAPVPNHLLQVLIMTEHPSSAMPPAIQMCISSGSEHRPPAKQLPAYKGRD
jgi:hypothetical protein